MNFVPFTYLYKEKGAFFVSTAQNTSGLTTYTFTSQNLGGPGLCVVCVHAEVGGNTGRVVNSVTIGGVTSTQAAQVNSAQNTTATTSAIFYLRQNATTANVVVNFAAAPSRCFISVFRVLNNISDTPSQTRTSTATSGTGLSLAFTSLPADAVGLACETIGLDSVTGTAYTNATLVYNTSAGGGTTRINGANFVTTAAGNLTVSVSHTSSTQPLTMAGAVWV